MYLKILLIIHISAALVGLGPSFFGHYLLRKKQSLAELKVGLGMAKKMENFNKIGSILVLLSGILLVIEGGYAFKDTWILISFGLYILVQIIIMAYVVPRVKKLGGWVFNPANQSAAELPAETRAMHHQVDNGFYVVSVIAVFFVVLMVIKPFM